MKIWSAAAGLAATNEPKARVIGIVFIVCSITGRPPFTDGSSICAQMKSRPMMVCRSKADALLMVCARAARAAAVDVRIGSEADNIGESQLRGRKLTLDMLRRRGSSV